MKELILDSAHLSSCDCPCGLLGFVGIGLKFCSRLRMFPEPVAWSGDGAEHGCERGAHLCAPETDHGIQQGCKRMEQAGAHEWRVPQVWFYL